ncbi:MAG: phage head closure protein [Bacteroidales bacterium]|nr:phage head closure protein [Bacteroidales bacterium]
MKQINTGELNRQITIQEYTTSINDNGFSVETWTDVLTTFAKVENTNGSRFFGAETDNVSKTSKFTIRYRSILKTKYDKQLRVSYDNKYYTVQYINNIDESNEFYEIIGEVLNNVC